MKKLSFLMWCTMCLFIASGFHSGCRSANTKGEKRIKLTDNRLARRVDISIDGQPFTSYIYPDVLKKPVLYPIRTAEGSFITRGWPMDPRPGERIDHPHHVGMWFNYGDVNGHDFWNNSNDVGDNKGPFGTIKHQSIVKAESGNDKATLLVSAVWEKPDGTILLKEKTTFIFTGSGQDRAIERITTLSAQKEKVNFKDNKEGVLGIRLARSLEHPSNKAELFTDANGKETNVPQMSNTGVNGKYLSSEGKAGDDVWGTRGKWVTLNGTVDNKPVSVVIMDHTQNPGYPTYWHARGYGLFAANPLGQGALSNGKETLNFSLQPGKSVTFRYKVIIHSGATLTNDQVNTYFTNFNK